MLQAQARYAQSLAACLRQRRKDNGIFELTKIELTDNGRLLQQLGSWGKYLSYEKNNIKAKVIKTWQERNWAWIAIITYFLGVISTALLEFIKAKK